MNRRTVLKSAIATTAFGALGMRRPQKSAAARRLRLIQQDLPMYEIVDLYANTEEIAIGGQSWIGAVRDVANDGAMIGEVVENGTFRPVTWDATGNMTYLPLGAYEGTWALGWVINSSGLAGGELRPPETLSAEGAQVDWETTPLVWKSGQLDDSFGSMLPAGTDILRLSDAGLFTGAINDAPARWTSSNVETMEIPSGYTGGAARAQNTLGDAAFSVWQSGPPWIGSTPGIWSAAGTVNMLDLPGGRVPGWAGSIRPIALSDDGQLVVHALDGDSYFGAIYRYIDGVPMQLADAYGEGARLADANEYGDYVGVSAYSGIPIPTLWVDDQPTVLADRIVPGPDRLLTDVQGINDARAIVGSANDSAGVSYSVLLRPV